MTRMPWMKLWTEDLDRDCSALSYQARGFWVWVLMDLRKHGGSRSLTLADWARVGRGSEKETTEAMLELIHKRICDSSVTRNALSQISNGESNAEITLTSRRIKRESKARELNKLRQERFRCHTKVTPPVTPKSRAHNATDVDADVDADADSSSGSGSYSGSRPENPSRFPGQKTAHNHNHPPVNFVLSKELLSWARKTMPEINTEAETEKFVDYYARDGTTFANWPAAWRKWMRDAVERSKAVHSRESAEEHNERLRRKSL